MGELIYEEESYVVKGAVFEVYKAMGAGFLEAVYQDALEIEFQEQGIPYRREAQIPVFYKGHKLDKEYFADFICYEKVVVELKCVARLLNAHKAQVINYLHGTKLPVGLLVNFAEASLKWERLTHFNEATPRD